MLPADDERDLDLTNDPSRITIGRQHAAKSRGAQEAGAPMPPPVEHNKANSSAAPHETSAASIGLVESLVRSALEDLKRMMVGDAPRQ